MPRHAKSLEIKRGLLQNQEPIRSENLSEY